MDKYELVTREKLPNVVSVLVYKQATPSKSTTFTYRGPLLNLREYSKFTMERKK